MTSHETSSIPLRGVEAATLRRPFWLSRCYLRLVGTLIEDRGIALVPGPVEGRSKIGASRSSPVR